MPNRFDSKKKLGYPSIIVVNQDRSYEKGCHWMVIPYTDREKTDHFDSVGKKPDVILHDVLINGKITYKYNNKRVQNYLIDYSVYTTAIIQAGNGR